MVGRVEITGLLLGESVFGHQQRAVATGTPLVVAGLGEILAERSGILNLSVEGMMLVGAVGAFIVIEATESSRLAPWRAWLSEQPSQVSTVSSPCHLELTRSFQACPYSFSPQV